MGFNQWPRVGKRVTQARFVADESLPLTFFQDPGWERCGATGEKRYWFIERGVFLRIRGLWKFKVSEQTSWTSGTLELLKMYIIFVNRFVFSFWNCHSHYHLGSCAIGGNPSGSSTWQDGVKLGHCAFQQLGGTRWHDARLVDWWLVPYISYLWTTDSRAGSFCSS